MLSRWQMGRTPSEKHIKQIMSNIRDKR
ncbi:YneF family protein [Texas Phoenix palm phytoplasma]